MIFNINFSNYLSPLWATLLWMGLCGFDLFAQPSLAVPTLTSPVMDEANLLTPQERDQLIAHLRALSRSGVAQYQVLLIDSLNGENLEEYSIRVTDQWKLGSKEKDNGLLLLIAVKDRKMRLEVGQGLEGVIPDALAGRYLDQLRNYFRAEQFADGIAQLFSEIHTKVAPEDVQSGVAAALKPKKKFSSLLKIIFGLLLLVFWLLSPIINRLSGMQHARHAGSRRYYYGSGSGGFGSGGGGSGGWGGSGGGFSGGGSSSSW